jgi:sulfur carrier protein
MMTPPAPSIEITLNGQTTSSPRNIPLLDFLDLVQFNPRLIAIEFNGEILHRQFWDRTVLQNGDRLEIVTIVGGG